MQLLVWVQGPVHAASMLAVTLKGEAVAPLMASPHHAAICQPLDGMDPTSVPSALSHLHLLPTVQHVPCQDLRPSTALPAISPMPGPAHPLYCWCCTGKEGLFVS